jgi:hypothetical protein
VALVRKGDREYSIALVDLEFVDPETTSAEWVDNKHPLEVYQYWLGLR